MVVFITSVCLLLGGYIFYGMLIAKIFGSDPGRKTPAFTRQNGVDYVPMRASRIFLIQLLNIAGLGPIYGAVMGALYGPAAFLWIVFGCIFAGGVHDYLSGMISMRNEGKSLPELVGRYLGKVGWTALLVFLPILLLMVGAVFTVGPANLIVSIISSIEGAGVNGPSLLTNVNFWIALIVLYYFLATVLPVDKIIGQVYPFFGVALFFMALGVGIMLIVKGAPIPSPSLSSFHPSGAGLWPGLFITVACGAISGFHATQSPMMARCVRSEKFGRPIFYGAMIAEGFIALIWAAASLSFFPGGISQLQEIIAAGGPGAVVSDVSQGLLGFLGGVLALVGVVVCPITSGDTSFRSLRLILGDFFNINQKSKRNRILVTLPLLGLTLLVTRLDFMILWKYFAWANQSLAVVVLWMGAVYLAREKRFHWVATLPAVFMTTVCTSYFMGSKNFWGLDAWLANSLGLAFAVVLFALFIKSTSEARFLGKKRADPTPL